MNFLDIFDTRSILVISDKHLEAEPNRKEILFRGISILHNLSHANDGFRKLICPQIEGIGFRVQLAVLMDLGNETANLFRVLAEAIR